jgi:hypothetical protein
MKDKLLRARELVEAMTPHEVFLSSVAAGIHNPDGSLTEHYGGCLTESDSTCFTAPMRTAASFLTHIGELPNRSNFDLNGDCLQQTPRDLAQLFEWMEQQHIKRYLEIGIWTGRLLGLVNSLFEPRLLAACDSLIVQEDLTLPVRIPGSCNFFKGTCYSPGYQDWRKAMGEIDLTFINADAEYEVTREAFEINREFPNRFLVFNDIWIGSQPTRFWKELEGEKLEFLHPLASDDDIVWRGIGVWIAPARVVLTVPENVEPVSPEVPEDVAAADITALPDERSRLPGTDLSDFGAIMPNHQQELDAARDAVIPNDGEEASFKNDQFADWQQSLDQKAVGLLAKGGEVWIGMTQPSPEALAAAKNVPGWYFPAGGGHGAVTIEETALGPEHEGTIIAGTNLDATQLNLPLSQVSEAFVESLTQDPEPQPTLAVVLDCKDGGYCASLEASDIDEGDFYECYRALPDWVDAFLSGSGFREDYVLFIRDTVVVNRHIMHNVRTWPALKDPRFGAGWLFDPGGEFTERSHIDKIYQQPGSDGWHADHVPYAYAVVLRSADLPEICDYISTWLENEDKTIENIDVAIGLAVQAMGKQICVHAPSLVDYDPTVPEPVPIEDPRATSGGTFLADWKR